MVRYGALTKDMFRRPSHVFKDIVHHPDEYFKGSIVLAILSVLIATVSQVLQYSTGSLGGASDISIAALVILSVVFAPIGILAYLGLVLWGSKMMKGHATYKTLFNVTMHTYIISIVLFIPNMLVFFFSPLAWYLIEIVIGTWSLVLTILAIKEANGFSAWRAVGALCIPSLIISAAIILLMVIFIVLGKVL